jgi:hypothetical protein
MNLQSSQTYSYHGMHVVIETPLSMPINWYNNFGFEIWHLSLHGFKFDKLEWLYSAALDRKYIYDTWGCMVQNSIN